MPLPDLDSGVESRESCAFSFTDHTAGLPGHRMTTSNQTRVAFEFLFVFYLSFFCVPCPFFLARSLFSALLRLEEYQVRGRKLRRGHWLSSEATSARQLCTCLHLTQACRSAPPPPPPLVLVPYPYRNGANSPPPETSVVLQCKPTTKLAQRKVSSMWFKVTTGHCEIFVGQDTGKKKLKLFWNGTYFWRGGRKKAALGWGSNASELLWAFWLIDPQQLLPENPINTSVASCASALARHIPLRLQAQRKGQFCVQMKPLRQSVYTHTNEGKSRSDWLLNKANRHNRKAFKSALDKQSPSKIAFDRREGFSLVTRLHCAVGGQPLGPNLERSETLVKRETWGRSCHFVETNKSPESKSPRSVEKVF